MKPSNMLIGLLLLFVATAASAASEAQTTTQPTASKSTIRHVLLIGLDGARADAIHDHAGPAIRSLIESGASCWTAQAVQPSVTQVNWASVLTGCTPQTHGINKHPVTEQQLRAMKRKVPTLFDVVAESGGSAMGFVGHWKLYPNETATPGARTLRSSYESTIVGGEAAEHLRTVRPAFCFVYIGDLDGLGHREGWMSKPYIDGIAKVDLAVQKLLDALDQSGIRQQTLVIVTSDHGGHGKSHGEGTPEDLTIPWIASGPGVDRGRVIERPISTIDTAPTVLAALGIDIPNHIEGHAVQEIVAIPTTNPSSP